MLRPRDKLRWLLFLRSVVKREGESLAGGAVGFGNVGEALEDFGIFVGEIVCLVGVVLEVVELPGQLAFPCLLADGLPGVVGDGELQSVAVEFPDHGFAAFEFFSGESGGEVGAIESVRFFGSRD